MFLAPGQEQEIDCIQNPDLGIAPQSTGMGMWTEGMVNEQRPEGVGVGEYHKRYKDHSAGAGSLEGAQGQSWPG